MPLVKCPKCKAEINVGALMGAVKSKAKADASRANGKLGGRPKRKGWKPSRLVRALQAEVEKG